MKSSNMDKTLAWAGAALVAIVAAVGTALAGVALPRWLVPAVVIVGTTVFWAASLKLPPQDEVAMEAHKVAWYWGGSFGGWIASLAAAPSAAAPRGPWVAT